MNLYFACAESESGDNLDLFVNAHDPSEALTLCSEWWLGRLNQTAPPRSDIRLFEIHAREKATVLVWHENVIEIEPNREPPPNTP